MTSRPALGPLALGALLALAPLSAPVHAEDHSFGQIKIDAGKELFDADCRRCHSTDADKSSYGPLLEGVVGRKAGSFKGYPYSPALKNASTSLRKRSGGDSCSRYTMSCPVWRANIPWMNGDQLCWTG